MRPIPIDTGSFEEIRDPSRNLLYVDKTAYLLKLITNPNARRFFISRPRRFGKSLMISTLKAIFEGRRSLFRGLAIADSDYGWPIHPVLHFNFGYCAAHDVPAFEAAFAKVVRDALTAADCAYEAALPAAVNFGAAIDALAERGALPVVLVDEYDDPVARLMDDPPAAEAVRDRLADFYAQLKDRAGKLRFLMITGVSKFTKMSIFSSLSNLVDVSLDDRYAAMLGYTESELEANLSEYLAAHAAKLGLAVPAYRAELRRLYNGYRFWREKGENVYNPVSVNLTMANQPPTFEMYWSETGRPSMLMKLLKRGDLLAIDPERINAVSSREFDQPDLRSPNAIGLLFQAGYLTIRDYRPLAGGVYALGVPDEEVRQDLALLYSGIAANRDQAWAASAGLKLLVGDFAGFFEALKSLYAALAYGPREGAVHEAAYVRALAMLLRGQGVAARSEVVEAAGRCDLVAEHPNGVYVFEFKRGGGAKAALSQIRERQYVRPYLASGRPVYAIGLVFDDQTHLLIDCAAEKLEMRE